MADPLTPAERAELMELHAPFDACRACLCSYPCPITRYEATVQALEKKLEKFEGWEERIIESTRVVLAMEQERDEVRARVQALEAELAIKWRTQIPDEQGLWWWWNGDEDSAPIPVGILYSGTDGSYFAHQGQWGWATWRSTTDMGGWWARLREPKSPEAELARGKGAR